MRRDGGRNRHVRGNMQSGIDQQLPDAMTAGKRPTGDASRSGHHRQERGFARRDAGLDGPALGGIGPTYSCRCPKCRHCMCRRDHDQRGRQGLDAVRMAVRRSSDHCSPASSPVCSDETRRIQGTGRRINHQTFVDANGRVRPFRSLGARHGICPNAIIRLPRDAYDAQSTCSPQVRSVRGRPEWRGAGGASLAIPCHVRWLTHRFFSSSGRTASCRRRA